MHTAFLKECSIKESTNIYFKVVPSEDDVSLLDIIEEITNLFGILSCGIQIYVKSKGLKNHETKVKGRVLRHLPKRPFEILQDATDIGLEQLFKLTKSSQLYGVGTKYRRCEPEWEEFTGGREYERRGHIHATVVGKSDISRHEVFHLRDCFVSPDSEIELVISPADTVYKIFSLYEKDGKYYSIATDKDVDEVIEKIRKYYI